MEIFEAARAGDLKALESILSGGVDPAAQNKFGFTALHCAAMACNRLDEATAVALVKTLIDAGAPVNAVARDGRTVLFMAAEFSRWVEPLKLLIEAGANPDVRNSHGVHIVTNSNVKEVQEFLSMVTGQPVPPPRVQFPSIKMSATEWRQMKTKLDAVFASLTAGGLVVLQDAGTTQEDGFADCAEAFRARGGEAAGLTGFCFYTRQDLNRAKRTSQLALAFWAAPSGEHDAMVKVGRQVVDAFGKSGFAVNWDESPSMRPIVFLKDNASTAAG